MKELKSFPQDLVLVGRSSILIKGLSNRLGIKWSLSQEWAPIARQVLSGAVVDESTDQQRVRFRAVLSTLKQWSKGKATLFVQRLPSPVRSRVAKVLVKMEDRKSRKALTRSKKI